jgi:hypothetical protein
MSMPAFARASRLASVRAEAASCGLSLTETPDGTLVLSDPETETQIAYSSGGIFAIRTAILGFLYGRTKGGAK